MDSDIDRFSKVQCHSTLACYNEIYDKKKQQAIQTKLNFFIKIKSTIADKYQESTIKNQK